VKVFNNIFFKHLESLSRPGGGTDCSYLPIADDSADAKVVVTAFLDSIGYKTVDVGPLAERSRTRRARPRTPRSSAPHWPPRPAVRRAAPVRAR
jgi:predicted dinucleotide-binding enzyme